MTWNELAERINGMSPEERQSPVYFREPYDEEAAIYPVTVIKAREDIDNVDTNPENTITINNGQFFLTV